MRKYTLFFFAFLLSLGTSWADVTIETGKPYTIKNNSSNGYLTINNTVNGHVALQSAVDVVYFQTGSEDGTYIISTAEEGGMRMGASGWNCNPEAAGADWTIEEVNGGVRLKASTGYLAPDATTLPQAVWCDKSATHDNGIYTIEEFTGTLSNITWNVIYGGNTVATATVVNAVEGASYTCPLSYPSTTLTGDVTVIAGTADQTIDLTATLGALYSTEATPVYYFIANNDKSAYLKDNGSGNALTWESTKGNYKSYKYAFIGDPFNGVKVKSKSGNYFYSSSVLCPEVNSWYSEPIEKTFVNSSSTQSTTFTITGAGSTGISNGVGLRAKEAWWSQYVFAGNYTTSNLSYSSYWNASETPKVANQVIIYEADTELTEDDIAITYNYKFGDNTIASSILYGEPGEELPATAFELPSTSNTSADYYTVGEKPEGTIGSTAASYDITLTQNPPFKVSDENNLDNATWYTLTIHSSKYYLNYVAEATSMDLTTKTTEYADKDLFCFVGDVFNGFKIYNKAAGSGYLLSSASSTFDGSTGGKTYAIMTAKATAEAQAYLWDVTKSSDITDGFYIGQHNNNSGKNRLNIRDSKLAYWNGGADAGSTFLVEEAKVTMLAEIETALNTSLIDIDENATLIYPSEYDPEVLNGYLEILSSEVEVDETSTFDEVRTAYNNEGCKYVCKFNKLSNLYGDPLSVTYTMKGNTGNMYGTIILPVNWTIPANWEVYSCSALEEDGVTLTLNKVTVASKNTPYIIKTSNTSDEAFQFIGYSGGAATDNKTVGFLTGVLTEDGTEVESDESYDQYVMQKLDGKVAFYQVDSSKPIIVPQYKCYLTLPAGTTTSSPVFYFPTEDDLTAVNGIEGSTVKSNAPIYDLQGRKVVNTVKSGIYIQNGKKFIAQ